MRRKVRAVLSSAYGDKGQVTLRKKGEKKKITESSNISLLTPVCVYDVLEIFLLMNYNATKVTEL